MAKLIGMTLLGLLLAAAAAAETRIEGSLPDHLGHYRIDRPDGWEPGDPLLIYSHGFSMKTPSAEDPPATAPDEDSRQVLLSRGYALAAGTYASRGWALFEIERAQLALLETVRQEIGEPGPIVLFGGSLGGLVSLKTAEALHAAGRPAAGVLAACPPAAGARTWDQAVDARLLFDAVCPASPIPPADNEPTWVTPYEDIPPDINNINDPDALLKLGQVANRIRQCTGYFQPEIFDTDAQRARRAQLKSLLSVDSDNFLKLQLSYAIYPLADLIRGPEKLAGFNAFDNREVDYGDAEVNDRVLRVQRDPLAAVKLAAVSDLTGRWGETKVLAIHGDGDELVFPEHLSALNSLRDTQSRAPVLAVVDEDNAEHCGFSTTEYELALTALEQWIATDLQPSAAGLAQACAAYIGADRCAYDADYRLQSLDTRTRPRGLQLDRPSPSHSGAWYDPAYAGEGLIVEVLPGGIDATVTWYSYPPAGSNEPQTWIAGLGRIGADGIHVADAFQYRGARFGAAFDPDDVQGSRWGEFTLAFDRCGDGSNNAFGIGSFRFEGPSGYGSGERQLYQLTSNAILPEHCTVFIQPQTPQPQSRYSGSWYRGPEAPGEGLQLQVSYDGSVVLVWYTFDPDGRPAWLIGTALAESSSNTLRLTLQRPRGTRFGEDFDPAEVDQPDWGEVELQFTDCDRAQLRWMPREAGWSAGEVTLVRLTRPDGSAECNTQ